MAYFKNAGDVHHHDHYQESSNDNAAGSREVESPKVNDEEVNAEMKAIQEWNQEGNPNFD